MLNLRDLQIWFYQTITERAGVEKGAAQSDIVSAFQMEGDSIQDLVHSTDQLQAADRMAIYRNAYFLRLVGVFEAEYSVLRDVLGTSLFNDFVLLFLQEYPPESYTLHDLSARFVDFLLESQPEDQREELWPKFLIELATLERLFQEVYLSEGVENINLDASVHFNGMSQKEEWIWFAQSGFAYFLYCRFPVHQYLQAHRKGIEMEIPTPKDSYLILYRKNYKVFIQELSSDDWNELRALT